MSVVLRNAVPSRNVLRFLRRLAFPPPPVPASPAANNTAADAAGRRAGSRSAVTVARTATAAASVGQHSNARLGTGVWRCHHHAQQRRRIQQLCRSGGKGIAPPVSAKAAMAGKGLLKETSRAGISIPPTSSTSHAHPLEQAELEPTERSSPPTEPPPQPPPPTPNSSELAEKPLPPRKSSIVLGQEIAQYIDEDDTINALRTWRQLAHRELDEYVRWLLRTSGVRLMGALNKKVRFTQTRSIFEWLMEMDGNVDEECLVRFLEALYVKVPDSAMRISDEALEVLEMLEGKVVMSREISYCVILVMMKDGREIEVREKLREWIEMDEERGKGLGPGEEEDMNMRIVGARHFEILLYGVMSRMQTFKEIEDVLDWMEKSGIQRTERVYSIMVQASYLLGDKERSEALVKEAKEKFGEKNFDMWNWIATGIATGKDWEGLTATLKEMTEANVSFVGTLVARMIRTYSNERGLAFAEQIFNAAVELGTRPTKEMYDQMIQACFNEDKMDRALEWLRKLVDAGFRPDDKTVSLLFRYLYVSGRSSGYTFRRLYYNMDRVNPDVISTRTRLDLTMFLQRTSYSVGTHLKDPITTFNESVIRQQMHIAIKSGQYYEAIAIFERIISAQIIPQRQTVLLALRAAFSLDQAPTFDIAKRIINSAKSVGVTVPEDQIKEVFRFAHFKEATRSPFLFQDKDPRLSPLHTADSLLRNNKPHAAIPLITSFITQTSQSPPTTYNKPLNHLQRAYTMLLRCYLKLNDIQACKSIVLRMIEEDIPPDLFLVRLIARHVRMPHRTSYERVALREVRELAKRAMNETFERTAEEAWAWVEVLRGCFKEGARRDEGDVVGVDEGEMEMGDGKAGDVLGGKQESSDKADVDGEEGTKVVRFWTRDC